MTDSDPDPDASDAPDLSTSASVHDRATVGGGDSLIRALVWFVTKGKYLLGGLAVGGGVVALAAGIEIPRSVQFIGIPFALSALLVGRPSGKKAIGLMGGPTMVYVVDVDLLDADGAGIFDIPSPRWAEWDVVDGELWWATPNLAFGKNVNQEEQTVEGTWRGTLPDPVLLRSLNYIAYNREELQKRAAIGDVYDLNGWSIIRKATVKVTKHVIRTFEKGTLPDDNETYRKEVDRTLESFGIEPEGSFLDDLDDLDGVDVDDDAAEQYLGNGTDPLADQTEPEAPADD